jgi:hypothetical protein
LKTHDIFSDSLIIITGDHGHEFYGTDLNPPTKTLYDDNIRQGMLIKTPKNTDFPVPDAANTIDVFPTIAKQIGGEIPSQCQGKSWQEGGSDDPRIVERIHPDYYNISIEKDSLKAIYTYESNNPSRPSRNQINEGPLHSEYYNVQSVRTGEIKNIRKELPTQTKTNYKTWAEEFISDSRTGDAQYSQDQELDQKIRDQLQDLGYR